MKARADRSSAASDNTEVLRRMVLDLIAQLDAEQTRRKKTENLLRQLIAARSGRRSEQITDEQLALFEAELKAQGVNVEDLSKAGEEGNGPGDDDPKASTRESGHASRDRRVLPAHLKRERIVHDLEEAEKHCAVCERDLREFGEETSERYEYIPAQSATRFEKRRSPWLATRASSRSDDPVRSHY